MEKKNSYTEMMKACTMTRKTATEKSVTEIYVDMVIFESLFNIQKEKLLKDINQSLDERNKKRFMELTAELKKLNLQYGT